MKTIVTAAIIATSATSAYAQEICDDLWFARNAIYQSAGYCFGSPLGNSVFDNTGCTTSNPTLDAGDRDKVTIIEQREAELDCKVDTNATTFDLTALPLRKLLRDQPIRTVYESACIGWLGPVTRVFAGRSEETPLGTIDDGDNVLYSHQEENGWFFVTVYASPDFSGLKAAGWLAPAKKQECQAYAG